MPLLDIDPISGAVETMHYDHNTKALHIKRETNIDTVLNLNDWARNNSDKTWRGQTGELWHVASTPEDLVWTWVLEFNAVRPVDEHIRSPFDTNADWEKFVWARLNSLDYLRLKTAPVHV